MSHIAIRVENLSKKYVISHQREFAHKNYTLCGVITEALTAPWRSLTSRFKYVGTASNANGNTPPASGSQPVSELRPSAFASALAQREDFWALKDVCFEISQGEVVGVIGCNGAGKTTLLKILSRITEPTKGRIEIDGRVASLLEVGTGFHPELTGRENIYLNGAILGMSHAEIRAKFEEIVAFAEVERFLDTPVKRYSSGMYVRLAFAVAAHLEPEILIVDEVLAVGDAQFQKKCLGKMQDVSRYQGRTVLFVSHSMASILQLTSRAIVLHKGRMVFAGPTQKAVEVYAGTMGSESTVHYDVEHAARRWIGTQDARIISLRFDRGTPIFDFDEDFRFLVRVRAMEDVRRIRFSMTIFTSEGTPVGTCFSAERPGFYRGEEFEAELVLSEARLAPGHYSCGVAVGKGDHRTGHVDFDVVLDTLFFEVRPDEGDGGTVASWKRGWGTQVFPDLLVRVPSELCARR
jgi:homopolymeric O-antigen transport system ATP-binding protein